MGRRALVPLPALLCVLVASTPAPAAASGGVVSRYALEVTPPVGTGQLGRYRLRLEYTGEPRIAGFKYVGREGVTGLRAFDEDNHKLGALGYWELSSGEYRLNFDLPPADDKGRQRVYLEFTQALRPRYGWGYRRLSIPWAQRFRLPVKAMQVAIKVPAGTQVPGFDCLESEEGQTCLRAVPASRLPDTEVPRAAPAGPLTFELRPFRDPFGIAVVIATYAALFALLAIGISRRYQALLQEKGIIPPASPVAYPESADPYRAPPPLPVGEQARPVLPAAERGAFRDRVVIGLLALTCSAGLLSFGASGNTSCPMPYYLVEWALVWGWMTWFYLSRDRHRFWLPALVAGSAPVLCVADLHVGSVLGIVMGLLARSAATLIGLFWVSVIMAVPIGIMVLFIRAHSGRGSSGTGGWGSSGGSSCGGGGGSSCGGGGGSSCGGGGGGGGCGG